VLLCVDGTGERLDIDIDIQFEEVEPELSKRDYEVKFILDYVEIITRDLLKGTEVQTYLRA
jgi:hypothetical protein